MAGSKISPDELSFESFRHSQGLIRAQILIFDYVENVTKSETEEGVRPNLNPDKDTIRKYARFINGPANQRHIHIDSGILAAEGAFEAIREADAKQKNVGTQKQIARALGAELIGKELILLGRSGKWRQNDTPVLTPRQIRLNQRISNGRASFLQYYGRDSNPTGYQVFDDMYSEVWASLIGTQLLEEHTELVESIVSVASKQS